MNNEEQRQGQEGPDTCRDQARELVADIDALVQQGLYYKTQLGASQAEVARLQERLEEQVAINDAWRPGHARAERRCHELSTKLAEARTLLGRVSEHVIVDGYEGERNQRLEHDVEKWLASTTPAAAAPEPTTPCPDCGGSLVPGYIFPDTLCCPACAEADRARYAPTPPAAVQSLCYEGDCAKMTGRARPCPIHDEPAATPESLERAR